MDPDFSIVFGDGCDGDAQANVLRGIVGYNITLNGIDVEVLSVDGEGMRFRTIDDDGNAVGDPERVAWNDGPLSIYIY